MPLHLKFGSVSKGIEIGDFKLTPEAMAHHILALGPTGCGKTEVQIDAEKQSCPRQVPMVVYDNKGPHAEQFKDWAVTSGYASRVIYMDLTSPDCPGFNMLTDNGLELSLQVEGARDAILMGGANFDFAAVPQMQRMLYMALYIAKVTDRNP
jgi:hypothetical protein